MFATCKMTGQMNFVECSFCNTVLVFKTRLVWQLILDVSSEVM